MVRRLDPASRQDRLCVPTAVGQSCVSVLCALAALFAVTLTQLVERPVADADKWLCQHYNKEDSIYVFGFSRGAFSARTFASFVSARHGATLIDATRCAAAPPP